MRKKLIPINGAHALNTFHGASRKLVAVKAQLCAICHRPMFRDSDALLVTPIQKRILDLMQQSCEIAPDILYQALYGGDPDGGPGTKTLDLHIHQLNKRLRSHGIVIQKRKKGHRDQPWRLMQIEAAE
jgi:hypothetical protein